MEILAAYDLWSRTAQIRDSLTLLGLRALSATRSRSKFLALGEPITVALLVVIRPRTFLQRLQRAERLCR